MLASSGTLVIVRSSIKDSLRPWRLEENVSFVKHEPTALMPEESARPITEGVKALRPEGIASCDKISRRSSCDGHPEEIPSRVGFGAGMLEEKIEGALVTGQGDAKCEKV